MADSYGEAHDKAMQMLADARLADPDEHFPYKAADAKSALKAKNLGPDADTKADVTGADFLSARIVEATEAYIAAQRAYLADPTKANHQAYEAATDDLAAARRTHRRARVDDEGDPIANIVGTTKGDAPLRAKRVGEE